MHNTRLEIRRPSRRLRLTSSLILTIGVVLTCAASTAAQTDSKDVLFLSGQYDSLSGTHGGGGGLQWVRKTSERSSINLGGYSYELGDSNHTFAVLGGSLTLTKSTTGFVNVSLGENRNGPDHDASRVFRVGITQALIAKKFYVEFEE